MALKKSLALRKDWTLLFPVTQKGLGMAWGRWERVCLGFQRWDTYLQLKASHREWGLVGKWWLFPLSFSSLPPPQSLHHFSSTALMLPQQLHVGKQCTNRRQADSILRLRWEGACPSGLSWNPQLPCPPGEVGGAQEVITLWLLLPQKPCLLLLGQWRV